jgi:alkylhydroperoxidase/carboxymuconolactone decarboxylase family protein
MEKKYFDPADLKKFGSITELQEEMGKKFFDWYGNVFKGDTALTEREKSLIALGVAHAIQCPYCIDAYTSSCLEKGADEEQMMEAVHVAAAIRSGTTLVYGVQMMNHADKLSM